MMIKVFSFIFDSMNSLNPDDCAVRNFLKFIELQALFLGSSIFLDMN